MKQLLTPKEMAKMFGVKVTTIYHWTHKKFIPHVKLGHFVRFDEQRIQDWIRKRSNLGRKTQKINVDDLLN